MPGRLPALCQRVAGPLVKKGLDAMHSLKKRMNWSVFIPLAIIAVMIAHQSLAGRNMAPAGPAVVATVDLEKAFNDLDERAQARLDLEAVADRLSVRQTELRNAVTMLEQDIESYADGSDAKQRALEEYTLAVYELQGFIEFAKRKIDAEGARMMGSLYEKIKRSAAAISAEMGYDIVIVDDSKAAIPEGVGEAEMTRQISARRMIYSNPTLDITADLVTKMNGAFVAGRP